MLQMRLSRGVWDVTTVAFLDVFYRDRRRNLSISHLRPMARTSASDLHHQQLQKDAVTAFQTDHRANWIRWLENEIVRKFETTGGGLDIIADVLQEGIEDREGFGFAFINIPIEDDGFNGGLFVGNEEQKEHLRKSIEQLASRMGVEHPDIAASACVLLIERTIEWARMTGGPKSAQTARLLFQCLQHA